MADQCRNCGAELFYGQRFCRACGRSTDPIVEEDAPTQRMPPPPEMWGSRQANTAPTSGQETRPVYTPPNYYQPPPPPIQPYTPPRPRATWPWVVGAIGAGLLVAMILSVIFFSIDGERGPRVRRPPRPPAEAVTPPPAPPIPPIPPLPALPSGVESVLGADNAEVDMSGNETVLTKRFTLDNTATVTVVNINGNISVEASDGPEAELVVTKRGGSEQDREAAQVKFFSDKGRLSLRTELPRNSNNLDVTYELKLPRQLGRVEVNSTNGAIRVSDIAAQIIVGSTNGKIELGDVMGIAVAKTVNGSIVADLTQGPPDRPMDFSSVNGNIEINLDPDFNANLTAGTTHGSIRLDDDFGITVQKPIVGQQASGRIGEGGPTLSVKTVNGNIRITK